MITRPAPATVTRHTFLLLFRCAACIALGTLIAGCPQSAQVAGKVKPTAVDPPPGTCTGSDCGDPPSSAAVAPGPTAATITAVNLGKAPLQQVPMTFGEPFRAGDIPQGKTIVAYMNGHALPTQADIKARNPDGSVRHAILTVMLPSLAGDASAPVSLTVADETGGDGQSLTPTDVLQSGFDASVDLNIDGQPWHLDARDLLQHANLTQSCQPYGRECSQWLSGPLVSEWIVGGPVLDSRSTPNPHVAVYFAIRAYGPAPVSRVRVDVIVENDWAYAADPHNVTYDATINVTGQPAYTIKDLDHYRQARWHKVLWWGESDPVYAQQDSQYLQSTLAVPRYQDVTISDKTLQSAMERVKTNCGPMQNCDQTNNMANAGAQSGIGPLPRWTSAYVIDPTHEAYEWMLANSDALGSYRVHYRDQLTGEPLSADDHPCVTMVAAAEFARCPVAPHADDRLPHCASQCDSPWNANISHHPAPAYVAYLVTGDWYYLQELTFWADWVEIQQNPVYRDYRTGLIDSNTLRAQAWSLRTLGYAAYILPDNDPFKSYFNQAVENNIKWYNQNYTDNPSANALHIITNGSIVYPNGDNPLTGISTWQSSFFTWAVGNLNDLGFSGADKLLNWVAAFQVDLMTSADYCWIVASGYELQVRDTKDSPFYDSLGTVYAKTYPKLQGVACGGSAMATLLNEGDGYQHYAPNVMYGWPSSPTGFPANFQIGLAVAADSDVPGAKQAWAIFESRSAKPDYGTAPQFAVVPRDTSESSP